MLLTSSTSIPLLPPPPSKPSIHQLDGILWKPHCLAFSTVQWTDNKNRSVSREAGFQCHWNPALNLESHIFTSVRADNYNGAEGIEITSKNCFEKNNTAFFRFIPKRKFTVLKFRICWELFRLVVGWCVVWWHSRTIHFCVWWLWLLHPTKGLMIRASHTLGGGLKLV